MPARLWPVLVLVALLPGCTADGSPPPAVRSLDAGFAATNPDTMLAAGTPGSRRLDPEVSRLKGPHFDWSVLAVADVRSSVPDDVADALGLPRGATPPPGTRLLLVDLDRPELISHIAVDPAADLSFEVSAGRTSRWLPMPPLGEPFSGSLAVAVPDGADPVLAITDEGRRQSLDLGTGRPGADAVAGYHPLRTAEAAAGSPVEVRVSGEVARLNLDGVEAALLPWTSERGWARSGRAWLSLGASITFRGAPTAAITVPARCFTVTGPDGTRYGASGGPVVVGPVPSVGPEPGVGAVELSADVPASVAGLTVTFRFCGSAYTEDAPVRLRFAREPVWTARLAFG